MRSQAGTSKTRRTARILCGSLAAFALTACTGTQSVTSLLTPPPYLALNDGAANLPLSSRVGYFTEEAGCIVFRTEQSSRAMTPVFPAGSTVLATDGTKWLGMYMNEAPVALEKIYRVRASTETGGAGLALNAKTPSDCPTTYVYVGDVGQSFANGDSHRLCSGVILCTSYRLD
jgi:hypothetical protein